MAQDPQHFDTRVMLSDFSSSYHHIVVLFPYSSWLRAVAAGSCGEVVRYFEAEVDGDAFDSRGCGTVYGQCKNSSRP